ncbi:MAG: protein kinase [Pseudolysinimonas sp.]
MKPSRDDVPIPALLGRYRPVSIVGHGGMATVYRAVDESLGRDVAIKMFRTGAAADLTRHEEESRVLAGLNHHGLVTLLDAGIDDSDPAERHPFLVMELVEGANLEDTLTQRTLNGREISEIAYDMAEALEFVHANGVVHRDIKPSNILLVDYGTSTFRTRARLTDFGIALDAETARISSGESMTGTAAYLSPEQASHQEVTSATDVYSLGLVLLRCFTGELAFPGASVESALARLTTDPLIPDDLPDQWTTTLRAMLAREPAARPDIAELTVAFRQAVIAASSRHKSGEIAENDEAKRLDAVTRYGILDTAPEGGFDRVTSIAVRSLGVPMAAISILATDRLWIKAQRGFDLDQISLLPEAVAQAAANQTAWSIPDALANDRMSAHPLVVGPTGLRSCAGAPIIDPDGATIGMLLVMDTVPREFSADDLAILGDLSAIVVCELELRLDAQNQAELAKM